MNRLQRVRILSSIGFFVCWILTVALVAYVISVIAWEWLEQHVELVREIDDDWTFVAIPVGGGVGAWGARRTRRARRFQVACIPTGLVLLLIGVFVSLDMFQEAHQLSGTGMFAGIGEAIVGLLFIAVAVAGGLILGVGVCGILSTRGASAVGSRSSRTA